MKLQFRTILKSAASIIAVAPGAALAQVDPSQQEIVITASPLGESVDETVTPVVVISGDDLVHRRQGTLGETLAGLPGIHFDNFGGGASRPVIRGQTSPRVQTLSDSANVQDASAISADHAITTEPLLLRGIEVLRGPATLLYGGGAIGGAINLLDNKIPTVAPRNGLEGAVEGRLGTGDDERSLVGGITAGVGPFAFRVEGVHRDSDDYRVPDEFEGGRVPGSYNKSTTFTAGGSWIGSDGYLGVAYTRTRSEYGLPGHSHEYEACHNHGTSLHCESHDHGEDDHDHEEEEHDHEHDHDHDHDHEHEGEVPVVKLRSERFDIRSEYADPLPGFERIRFRMSHTDYAHDEIEHEGEIATEYRNKALDLRLELTHKPIAGLRGVVGVQHTDSEFSGITSFVDGETGEIDYTPYDISNTAIFLHETLGLGPVRLELAARQEWQKVEPQTGLDAFFPSIEHKPFSFSGAAIWNVADGYSAALSLTRSQRAPNVQELFAFGPHLASNTYEIGLVTAGTFEGWDSDAEELETAKSINLTLRKTRGPTTFTIGAYHQDFDNYIYGETLDRYENFRLIRYVGADATFTGVDGEVRHQLTPNVGIAAFGDYVRAKLSNGGGNLPRIPAGRLGVRGEGEWGDFSADAEYYRTFRQEDIADFETETGGYDMLNMTLAYQVDLGPDRNAELFVRGTNLTDSLAYNHASFVKDASPLRGRNFVFGLRTAF